MSASPSSSDAIPVIARANLPTNHRAAIDRLIASFHSAFGRSPSFIARAPGRVNLIGEHIDYCGYSVLPMAIERHILIAADASPDPTLRIRHVAKEAYPDADVPLEPDGAVRVLGDGGGGAGGGLAWHQYVLCGFRGVHDHLAVTSPSPSAAAPAVGVDLMTDGDIPPSSGLSSSSALVVCAALVAMRARAGRLGLAGVGRRDMASLCASAERHIGTEGGGMDQAIALCGEAGQALWIDFGAGLDTRPVTLPPGYSWVIAHCGRVLNKAATDQFNQRVAECRLAARLLSNNSKNRLADAQVAMGADSPGRAAQLAGQRLRSATYSLADVAAELGDSPDAVSASCLTSESARRLAAFQLRRRALHVFGEAQRVLDFRDAAAAAAAVASSNSNADAADAVARQLGRLMNESHASCSELYECSCPELDRLCRLCREVGGALGSRLTGAGWGGCCVSLVPDARVDQFLASVGAAFLRSEEAAAGGEFLAFASPPARGAYVVEMLLD